MEDREQLDIRGAGNGVRTAIPSDVWRSLFDVTSNWAESYLPVVGSEEEAQKRRSKFRVVAGTEVG